jgi:hypothetical protein
MKNIARILFVLSATAALCLGDDPLDGFRKSQLSLKSEIKAPSLLEQARLALAAPEKTDVLRDLLDVKKQSGSFLRYLFADQTSGDLWAAMLLALENARTDEQTGGTPHTAGSTSLVSKPGAAAVLSAAVEAGALTQSTSNGAQATFRGNVVGVARMLLGEDVYRFCKPAPGTESIVKSCDQGVARFLKPLSFSVTLDPNGQKAVTVPVTGSATAPPGASSIPASVNLPSTTQRVSAWGVRYSLRNPHVLDSQKNRSAYFGGLIKAGNDLADKTSGFFLQSNADDTYREWLWGLDKDGNKIGDGAIDNLAKLSPDISQSAFEDAFSKELDRLVKKLRENNKDFDAQGGAAWRSYQDYFAARETALDALNGATMLTLEYTHNDPANQPSLSNLRFILSWQASKTVMLTANLAAEMYNTLPQGVKVTRFRDLQAAAQMDISLQQWGKLGNPVLSAAGYFQYQHDPALINITSANLAPGTNIPLPNGAATVLGQKGSIGIGQVKLTIPFKSTGVSFPIGVTWSNRTELIKATDVSGHIGITFDLDSLFTQKKSQ